MRKKTDTLPLTGTNGQYFWMSAGKGTNKHYLMMLCPKAEADGTVIGIPAKQVQAVWKSGNGWAALTGQSFVTLGHAKHEMELWAIDRMRQDAEERAHSDPAEDATVIHRAGPDTWSGIVCNAKSSHYDDVTDTTSYSLDGQIVGFRGYMPGLPEQGGGMRTCWVIQNGPSTEADGFVAGPIAHAAALAAIEARYK